MAADEDRQRLDRWLWHARVVRTRAAAADLVRSGHVRLDGQRVTGAAHPVKLGQVLTVSLNAGVRVLRVRGFAERRGDATSVADLLDDITDESR
ncbi:RNA-binding S4 protein [Azorhizobium caulinodans ORS 571]|uniref:RNA-binding S4 protein n=1 Tax=Azorhizobium caulinodans (strain ATCC 43989 / DSM 5975 / JCM 20966 / LMG 6465 / NBRC 14845 / NCIMB 13405 / ORS 571) TaxID=438753 RepID=A8IJ10_AZOC5|nr:S4 domain-containing protein [Azorhizobium caulinodans]BAF86229.1 RNA-binding S4 protein [Azorhizobium caulinodans ORS 571]